MKEDKPQASVEDKDIKATDKFKLYLNTILNKIPDDIHEELWNKLFDVIGENTRTVAEWQQNSSPSAAASVEEAAEAYANSCVDIKDKDTWQACYCDFKAGVEWLSLQR